MTRQGLGAQEEREPSEDSPQPRPGRSERPRRIENILNL